MGNSCEIGECLQPMDRESVRRRSLSDPAENMTVKNMIQIKKGRLADEYQVNEQVGEGSYGSVFRVTHRLSKVVRAAKRIQKRKKSIQALEESLILKRLDHPNIVRIYDIYYEKKYIHIVMDYCQGGQLFARIVQEQTLTEAEAALYMKQLLSAIQHCHAHNIMHRDLKPENIMFLSKQEKSLKIIDFGVGTSFSERNSTLKVGSVYYMAPEVIKKQYNQKCDIWSLGVILYIMLTGRPPFIGPTDNDIYQLILKGQVPFPPQHWDRISPHAKDLVQKMLAYEPANRISAKEALGHRWIKEAQGQEGSKKLFVGNQFESIRSFCRMNQFQSAIVVFISHHFMQSDLVRELQARFKSLDLNGDGQISWEEFQRCYLDSMPPIPETELRTLFSKLDKNHSGYIDYSEFISSAIDRTHLLGQNLVEKAFDMIDKNHNGSLSRQELMQAFGGCNYEVYRQILRDFDLNNDGEISKYEFKLAMKGLLKR